MKTEEESQSSIELKMMTTKELMSLYGIKHWSTWQKLIKPLAFLEKIRKQERRRYYTIHEIKTIFSCLGAPREKYVQEM